MTDARRVQEVFDAWADEGRDAKMEAAHGLTAGRALEAMPAGDGRRFLDLGTGNGWAVRAAESKGWRGVGVDVAPRMLQRAHDAGVESVRAVFEALPFRDASFHGSFSMEALYYASDLEKALAEARRVLAPGARLDAVVDRYEENPASHDWDTRLDVGMHLLSEAAWAEAFARAGFKEVETQRLRTSEGTGDSWQAEQGSLHVSGRLAR